MSSNQTAEKGLPESKVLKEKNDKDIQPLGQLSRIVGRALVVPPPMPMVFLVHNYVRAVHMPLSSWGIDGGRTASLALDEPDYHSAG